jgi:chromatin structure-remodeling complex subunit SFH1
VQIYTHILRDRIEWDLSSPLPVAVFSASYARDLGLSGEAVPLIAHAIQEELLKHKKDALDWQLFKRTHPTEQAKWEHPHGSARPKISAKNAKTGAEGLKGVWRDWWEREEFGPILVEIGYEEMEKREAERVRDARRTLRGVVGKRRR